MQQHPMCREERFGQGVFGPGPPLALCGSPRANLTPKEPGWQVGGQPSPGWCWVCSQLLSAQFGPYKYEMKDG